MPQAAQALEAGRILPSEALSGVAGRALAAVEAGLLAVAQVLARGDDGAAATVFGAAVAGRVRLVLNGQQVGGPEGAPVLTADLPDGLPPGPRGAMLALHPGAPGPWPLMAVVAVWGARLTVGATAGEGVWISATDPATGAFAAPVRRDSMPIAGGGLAVDPTGWADWPGDAQAQVLAALRDGARPVWSGSLATEVLRLLTAGGLCLMPGTDASGPAIRVAAMLVRAAGGVAEDMAPGPPPGGIAVSAAGRGLILGSSAAVARLRSASAVAEAEPASALFGRRGLFRS